MMTPMTLDSRPLRTSAALAMLFSMPLGAMLGASLAQAQDMPPGLVEADLLPGWETASGTRMTALRVELDANWKTYWRAPGDAGIPPQFDFSRSQNVASVAIHWPRPQVFDLNGMRSVGYLREMILPIEITPRDPSLPVEMEADVAMGICHDICVPVELGLQMELSGPGAPDAQIRTALTQRPETFRGQATCHVEPITDGMRVTAEIRMPSLGAGEVGLFELNGAPVWISDSENKRQGDMLVTSADFVPEDAKPFALDRSALTITVLGNQGRAVEIRGCKG
jgi:DsbC/DsbD-like thiol-disulfide interchange protein